MTEKNNNSLDGTLVSSSGQTDLERFEGGVHDILDGVGLPTDELFVSVQERVMLMSNLQPVVEKLPKDIRKRSQYISKMVAAAAVGLFDAALNYLWNELVDELRTRVASFDLNYFFDIAAGDSNFRKQLKDKQDLANIDDARLLRASMQIGLLSEVGFERLDHIRFMRNHASAAHPNQNSLTGLELVTFLRICIDEVINQPLDRIAADTSQLLSNIKKSALDESYVEQTAVFFKQLSPDRADTLGNGLFGLYTAPDRTTVIADNVRLLWPRLWPYISDSTRYEYGLRHARASAIIDTGMATAARELLDLAEGGNAYLAPDVRALDMRNALEALRTAHHGMNNFYTEEAPASLLLSLIGSDGEVPDSVRDNYVQTIVECFLGNGHGIAMAAEPSYRQMIQRFSSQDAGIALRTCVDPVFSSLLGTRIGQRQWKQILEILEPKIVSRPDRDLLKAIKEFSGEPEQLRRDTRISKLANGSNRS